MTEKEGSDKNKRYSERLPEDVSDKLLDKAQSDGDGEGQEEILSAFLWNEGGEDINNSKKNNKEQTHLRAAVAVIVIAAIAAFSTLIYSIGVTFSYGAPTEENVGEDTDNKQVLFVPTDDDNGILTTSELYAECSDTVVSILTETDGASGVGSGFILTKDGYIATANHVVSGMDKLKVVLSSGAEYEAKLICGNELTDIALLKIEASSLPTVKFGSSGDLAIGERIIAIGTPASIDYAGSVCSGEVSYIDRTVSIYDDSTGVLKKKMTLIQTDAPVNPGNSGCPVFNGRGEVVGIITMKLGNNFSGIGFAIPSDGARSILDAMMKGKSLDEKLLSAVAIKAPKLGIFGETQSVDGVHGVIVRDFSEDSAARSALSVGDLILQIDDTPVFSSTDLRRAIEKKSPDEKVSVTVQRGGQKLTFDIVLGK